MSGRLNWARNCEAAKKSASCFPAAIDVPADQILAAGRGHVIAVGSPGDPFAGLRLDEQGEQFLAVAPAQPADRAVVIGDHENFAVGREIDAPCDAGARTAPELLCPWRHRRARSNRSRARNRTRPGGSPARGTVRIRPAQVFVPWNFGASLSSQSVTGRPSTFAGAKPGGRRGESRSDAAARSNMTGFASPEPSPKRTDGGVARDRKRRSQFPSHVRRVRALQDGRRALRREEAKRRLRRCKSKAVAARLDVVDRAVAGVDIRALAPAGGVETAQEAAATRLGELRLRRSARDERRAVARPSDVMEISAVEHRPSAPWRAAPRSSRRGSTPSVSSSIADRDALAGRVDRDADMGSCRRARRA